MKAWVDPPPEQSEGEYSNDEFERESAKKEENEGIFIKEDLSPDFEHVDDESKTISIKAGAPLPPPVPDRKQLFSRRA